ncbi:unnamed protein product [Phytophthora fragariaefolia]|uniref:Unnamed protein product n=1 Tax=Phytophthora fragariaefolia TaxID=1490495 RepID=A0A9W6XYR6_9STRA|nr:unnamed protein product [Phytophthora fragariaefolia]
MLLLYAYMEGEGGGEVKSESSINEFENRSLSGDEADDDHDEDFEYASDSSEALQRLLDVIRNNTAWTYVKNKTYTERVAMAHSREDVQNKILPLFKSILHHGESLMMYSSRIATSTSCYFELGIRRMCEKYNSYDIPNWFCDSNLTNESNYNDQIESTFDSFKYGVQLQGFPLHIWVSPEVLC